MTSTLWDAPLARGPVLADVRVPGSKSITNRALVLAALATGRSTLRHPLRSRDTAIMVTALRTIGVRIDAHSDEIWTVDPEALTTSPANVEVGNAGTVLRFVPTIASFAGGPIGFDGDPVIRQRPVGPLLNALRDLGAIIDDGGRGCAPFVVHGQSGLPGGPVRIDASSSSQLITALLLAGARFDRGVEVTHIGDRAVPNAPHVSMTIAMLADRGVEVAVDDNHWQVGPRPIAAHDETVEPDLSSAAPFLAAAAVTGGRVRVQGWPAASTQPGALLPELLAAFGASYAIDDDGIVVRGGGTITGADLNLRNAGELTPVLAAVAALASSPSRLSGVEYLRGHETDRLAALTRELTSLGASVRETADGLEITPKPLHGGVFATYDDHRMAMAAAVVGLVVPNLQIENVETTAKTLPGFAALWRTAVDGQGATR